MTVSPMPRSASPMPSGKKVSWNPPASISVAGLRQDPGNTDALLDLGELLMEMGQTDEAGEKFRRVIELAPEATRRIFLPWPLAAAPEPR